MAPETPELEAQKPRELAASNLGSALEAWGKGACGHLEVETDLKEPPSFLLMFGFFPHWLQGILPFASKKNFPESGTAAHP